MATVKKAPYVLPLYFPILTSRERTRRERAEHCAVDFWEHLEGKSCAELWVIRRTAGEGLCVARWIRSCEIFQLLFFLMIGLLMVFVTVIDSLF